MSPHAAFFARLARRASDVTPDQLITFAVVAEHGNISRAAVVLHLSQSAVSGQLRLLQDEFGEPLYLREGRGVRLAPADEHLAVYAVKLRDTYRDARAYRNAEARCA